MSQRINDVTVVGGGDSGLLSALAVRQFNPSIDVSVVDDFERDVPQVGKATFREIRQLLHGALDIDEGRFIAEVKPVWKLSAYFRDWCGYDPFQFSFDSGAKFPAGNTPDALEGYYHWYDEAYSNADHLTIGEEIAAQGKSPWYFNPQKGEYESYDNTAYHLNTKRFNGFLRTLCRERDISLIDDRIEDVETTDNHIQRVRSKSQSYEADLYIDATGFNRLLKRELDGEFVEFDIPLDSAYTTNVECSLSEVVPATVLDTGEHGWFWQIDTYDDRDLGYVFASEFVSDEGALTEFLDHCGESVSAEDVGKYEFDSGYYDPAWEENCVAIGNSAGFVEPLQSPALTTNTRAAVQLGSMLSAHGRINDDAIHEAFNASVRRVWESVYDFISIHYHYSSGDNEFWNAMQSIPLSPRIEFLIEEFDRTGLDRNVDPTTKNPEIADFEVYDPMGFYVMMRNMGATSGFYESTDVDVSREFKAHANEVDQATTEHIERFMTTEEMYRSVVEAEDSRGQL